VPDLFTQVPIVLENYQFVERSGFLSRVPGLYKIYGYDCLALLANTEKKTHKEDFLVVGTRNLKPES